METEYRDMRPRGMTPEAGEVALILAALVEREGGYICIPRKELQRLQETGKRYSYHQSYNLLGDAYELVRRKND